MTGTSGYTSQVQRLKLSDTSDAVGGSSDESEYLAVTATEPSHATSSSSSFLSARSESIVEGSEKGQCSAGSVAEQIEQSKSHWRILSGLDSDGDDEVAEVSNVQVFKALQSHPTWGDFFFRFNEGEASEGWSTLQVGEKFAEGGQAELFHAKVTWGNPKRNEWDLEQRTEWVLKVFKKGTFLRDLQYQLPHGYLQFHAETREYWKSPTAKKFPRYCCSVHRGTLLADGRFAFLMRKEHFDLRTLIEQSMKLRSGNEDCGPFSKEDAELMMFCVALGLDWLHSRDIVHRDLKASNVLVYEFKSCYPKWVFSIADYECSIGVVGTGFFRAPEILQALQERKLSQRLEVFSKAADVYSYGMTCYEILTGKLPFDDHSRNDYNFVINGKRPVVPEYVEDWTRELLRRCWDSNPEARPKIEEILKLLLANSIEARKWDKWLKDQFGENYKKWHYIKISKS